MSKIERRYFIYMHTNTINNKKYIGLTQQSPPSKRWRSGAGSYYQNTHFSSSIKKYGWNKFSHEILFQNLTKNEAEILEIAIIKHYKSTNQNFGYNIESGGNANGRMSEETRIKLCKALKGRKSPMKGKFGIYNHTDETKSKISKKMSIIQMGKNNTMYGKTAQNARKVLCIETNVEYTSLKSAQENTGIQFKNIHKVCNGKRHTAGGYHWKYAD